MILKTCLLRTPPALLAVLLAACGDDGSNGTVSDSASSTGASASSSTGPANPTNNEPTGTSNDQPTGGTDSQSGTGTTESTVDPTTAGTQTSSTTVDPSSTTTNPVDTDPAETGTGTTLVDTTLAETTQDTSGSTTDDTTGEPVEPCACPEIEVPLDDGIFVLSDNSEIYKFFPESNTFEALGAFNCGGMTDTFSMAVDRLGFAWVMFNNPQGEIWKVDLTNVANCTDPGYNQGQGGVNYFGMAYVSNSESDQCDQLYGNTFDGFGGFDEGLNIGDFITVDPNTLAVSKLGKTNFNGAELTGTGDGRAFMFGGVNPAKLVEVNKLNGQFVNTLPLPGLNLTNAFAFAFFAGDFYFFTESANPLLSKVTHMDYDDSDGDGKQQLTTVVNQAPIRIVGAGVSTCAPFIPM